MPSMDRPCTVFPAVETEERKGAAMVDIGVTDNLDEAEALLRGASQILQALAAEPDSVDTGECLNVLSGAIDEAARYVEAAREHIAQG